MDDSKITELYVSGSEQALSETSFGRDTQYRFTGQYPATRCIVSN